MTKHHETSQKNTGLTKTHSKPGPKSIKGKANSSKNAITHGATCASLMNEQEEKRFRVLCTQLRKEYPYKSNLIETQIIRICKTTVQLERVQNIIDAEFAKSRAQSNSIETTTELLKMSPAEKSLIVKSYWNVVEMREQPEVSDPIVEELIALDLKGTRVSVKDLLQKAPLFAQYALESAENQGLTMDRWIEQELIRQNGTSVFSESPAKSSTSKLVDSPPDLESAFKGVNVDKLNLLIKQMSGIFYHEFLSAKKIEDYFHLSPIVENSAMPNFETLDHLMRYQTTLQNQLSKFTGELLLLVDREKSHNIRDSSS